MGIQKVSQNGSNSRIISKAVMAVVVRQPSMATRPPRESSANISTGSEQIRSVRAYSWLIRPSLNNADPMIHLACAEVQKFCALSRLRMPPPTWQGSWPTICFTSERYHRRARCVEVDELDDGIFRKAFDPVIEVIKLQFLFSPWTNCTILPPIRSIEGISMAPHRHVGSLQFAF